MKTHFNDVANLADNINRLNFLVYELKVSRRNGYYAVDAYEKHEPHRMRSCLRSGLSCKECYEYLNGIKHAIIYQNPF